jgi:hypothetical protein
MKVYWGVEVFFMLSLPVHQAVVSGELYGCLAPNEMSCSAH